MKAVSIERGYCYVTFVYDAARSVDLDNERFLADSRARVDHMLRVIGDAATHAKVAAVVENQTVFQIESFSHAFDPAGFCSEYRREIAHILRAERSVLSDEEIEDALSARISYGIDDAMIVDWNTPC